MPGPLRGYLKELIRVLMTWLESFGCLCGKSAFLIALPKRKTLDSLRRPVGRDLLAGHAPDFLGVALEESVEEAFAELIAHPIFEVRRIGAPEKARAFIQESTHRVDLSTPSLVSASKAFSG